jgi:parallel beta-helix repeat protein
VKQGILNSTTVLGIRSAMLIISTLWLSSVYGQTPLCGVVDVPRSLIQTESPYLVTGDIYVPSNSRLTIESGVELLIAEQGDACDETGQMDWLDSQMVSIKVDGVLHILGEITKPVIIRPQNPKPGIVQWYGIRTTGKTRITMQIEALHISGANRGIWTDYSKFNISNSVFYHNNCGLYLHNKAHLGVFNNTFAHNKSAGIYIENSNPKIVANVFYNNTTYGIWSDSYPRVLISYNLLHGNGEEDCYKCPSLVGKNARVNTKGDSTDLYFNVNKDPIFIGSKQHELMRKADISLPTQKELVADTVMQQIHKEKTSTGLYPKETPLHPYIPGKYSPLLHSGPDNALFENEDGSRGHIGATGGSEDRTSKPFEFSP